MIGIPKNKALSSVGKKSRPRELLGALTLGRFKTAWRHAFIFTEKAVEALNIIIANLCCDLLD
jgi:hypothetical protein